MTDRETRRQSSWILLFSSATMSLLWLTCARRFAAAVVPRIAHRPALNVKQTMSSLAWTPQQQLVSSSHATPTSVRLSSLYLPTTVLEELLSWSTWLIKRTFQPSILRKRRKTGLLTRNKSVGGRKVLARRRLKGRARLAGC